ncbi:helix-hairpin-helix domain-containing protein [Kribbella sp. NPDC050470]|uniref:helix-hairpin-helix domain-containing protein n=1 Tax=unclassified Kribbella TaxID=2644121 RepID=UPI00379FC38A
MPLTRRRLINAQGEYIELGTELGRGGEGSVFVIERNAGQVAKVYHKVPDDSHQVKLREMVGRSDATLNSFVAWPQQTLHERPGGPIIGFTMPKMGGREPAHAVYSPAHRKREEPNRKWDFLLLAARNTAAAVEAVHARGHVIGDVNQNGVLIGNDGRAALIDSDSFQIRANGKTFRCRVGVPEFTPPELQGLDSFESLDRTPNHDNFGLAVLVFQFLLGGRHPFSGVPLRSDVGNDMSDDIRAFRYADSRDSSLRGLTPPPRSIAVSLLPESVGALLTRAFTEEGVRTVRPTASEWVVELDRVLKSVKACSRNPLHVFAAPAANCPWCRLDQQGVFFFLPLVIPRGPSGIPSTFDITKVWREIESVRPPAVAAAPVPSPSACSPLPRPAGVPSKRIIAWARWATVMTTIVLSISVGTFWPLFAGAALAVLVIIAFVAKPLKAERQRRQAALDSAKDVFERLNSQYESVAMSFERQKRTMADLRGEFSHLATMEAHDLAELQRTAHQRAQERHLRGCFIDSADIPGIGPVKKAALRSFGIETAADVSGPTVMQIRGFGERLTQNMLAWRANCERRFKFNPADPALRADETQVQARYSVRRAEIQRTLMNGKTLLETATRQAEANTRALHPELAKAAAQFAQAQSDLSLVN